MRHFSTPPAGFSDLALLKIQASEAEMRLAALSRRLVDAAGTPQVTGGVDVRLPNLLATVVLALAFAVLV